jgi:AcrR family transcriptional regulator
VLSERREVLAEGATDYVLEHGLIDLSLRPLAAALGTSDRMLLYHFRDKLDLVATVLGVSNDRSVKAIHDLRPSPDVRRAVLDLWGAVSTPGLARCQRLYVEAAALGVLGTEPYASVVAEANEVWLAALADHLRASGIREPHARRAARLVEAAFMGLQLDEPLEEPIEVRRSVRDLAEAVTSLWAPGTGDRAE